MNQSNNLIYRLNLVKIFHCFIINDPYTKFNFIKIDLHLYIYTAVPTVRCELCVRIQKIHWF